METFLKHLAKAIYKPHLVINADQRLVDLPNWDSLIVLTTLSMLDREYGVLMSGPDLQSCETVKDLYEKVQSCK